LGKPFDILLYALLKIFVRLGLPLFCKQIQIRNKEALASKGPLLITANHPNAFLDAIIIAAYCKHRVHFLARGDFFSKPWQYKLLRLLNTMPVFKQDERKENKELNNHSFKHAETILSQNGTLLVFIEGICVNKHELQPFKKTAARIALSCQKKMIPLSVLPVVITYDSLNGPGKTVCLEAGTTLPATALLPFPNNDQSNIQYFNQEIFNHISGALQKRARPISKELNPVAKLISIIACLVYILPYGIIQKIVRNKTRNTVFYDAVLFTTILLLYPVYLLLITWLFHFLHLPFTWIVLMILLHLLAGWYAVQCLPYPFKNRPENGKYKETR
jgi:1-acyl-sn-glycerol-3-phosphate acyltransferase